ncbi:sulfatase-like hydrolase/transferase [Flammeovirgaceae bacterium SG7u.111]|nr:sulfatase-like hydrolase/transferase [Flammeovirgaceae bacterium SG7u.132]WPO37650.1 sulfatase-like hydrolase/transferase [Flammeovirgaceae bacterium SG7u.111]
MKFTLKLLILWLTFSGTTTLVFSQKRSKKKKPNVLLIFTDDHRFTGIHALGGMPVKTPNIDKLAENGTSFTSAYLMGAFTGATCVASRAMLHTGRDVFQLDKIGRSLPTDHTTIGEAFQEAGYHSHAIGKWHQDRASLARSFNSGDKMMGLSRYLVDHFRMPLWDWDAENLFPADSAYLLTYNKEGKVSRRLMNKGDKRGPIGTEKNGPHTSEIFAEAASDFITNYEEKNPFFMYLAFHAPHDPRQAPQKYLDMYPPSEIELTPSYAAQHAFDNGHMFLRDEQLAPWPRTKDIAKKELASYYAIITHLDEQIGKVIAALKASGQYENTIIVLAGDSGLAVGNHGLLGKQSVYDEDGIHVPFIISGGAIKDKGRKIDAFCYIHDIFPTVCDLAKVPKPASVTGKSMLPVISGEKDEVRDYTYHAYRQFQRAYRKGDYKLIEYVRADDETKQLGKFVAGSRVTQLFHIKNDPWETTNLAIFPEYKGLLQTMQKEMKETAASLNDKQESVGEKFDFWDYY